VAWEIIEVPAANRLLAPVLLTVPLQLLAYHIAVYRGTGVRPAAQPGEIGYGRVASALLHS